MQGRRWQTGSWLLSLARPSESNQREGRPWFTATCRGVPVLLAVKSGCGSRSINERTHKGCELRQVLADFPFHGCDCSASHKGPNVTQRRDLILSTVVS